MSRDKYRLLPKGDITRKMISKRRRDYFDELLEMRDLGEQMGFQVYVSLHHYQVAKIKSDGVSIVAYPHKTSAGNYHLRLRDENSPNAKLAYEICVALKLGHKPVPDCTFQNKTLYKLKARANAQS